MFEIIKKSGIRFKFRGKRWKIPAFSLLWWICILGSAATIAVGFMSFAIMPYILFI